ncbi:MAG: hypothetical protein EOP60_08730 [Sphingomonadales bacterium]|nr:MAG: hypothetical protein EOP60_08730 [Sphingomonadales bacterium]
MTTETAAITRDILRVDHAGSANAVRAGRPTALLRALYRIVAGATELLVWVSTYGVSSRLHRKLRDD